MVVREIRLVAAVLLVLLAGCPERSDIPGTEHEGVLVAPRSLTAPVSGRPACAVSMCCVRQWDPRPHHGLQTTREHCTPVRFADDATFQVGQTAHKLVSNLTPGEDITRELAARLTWTKGPVPLGVPGLPELCHERAPCDDDGTCRSWFTEGVIECGRTAVLRGELRGNAFVLADTRAAEQAQDDAMAVGIMGCAAIVAIPLLLAWAILLAAIGLVVALIARARRRARSRGPGPGPAGPPAG